MRSSTSEASATAPADGGFALRRRHQGDAIAIVCLTLALGIAGLALRIAAVW